MAKDIPSLSYAAFDILLWTFHTFKDLNTFKFCDILNFSIVKKLASTSIR